MLGALAIALALGVSTPSLTPAGLPPLPARGLARQERTGLVLETLRGRRLGRLSGFGLMIPRAAHGLLVTDRHGRLFVVDVAARRIRRIRRKPERFRGCSMADATTRDSLLLCGRRIEVVRAGPNVPVRRTTIAKAPDRHGGSWEWAEFAPNGRDVLAEWSGECEIPTAFLITGRTMRPYGGSSYAHAPESEALGWLPDGRAVVQFDTGECGGGIKEPGVYAIPGAGRGMLLLSTGRKPVLLSMWGG